MNYMKVSGRVKPGRLPTEIAMKCLSFIQPWATLVILGAKRWETRSWHTHYRGPLAIHASRNFPEAARDLCYREPYRSLLVPAGYKSSADLPLGRVLGTVDLLDCLPARVAAAKWPVNSLEIALGDYRSGRWAFQLDHAVRFALPIPVAGRLGLFDVPEIAEAQSIALPLTAAVASH